MNTRFCCALNVVWCVLAFSPFAAKTAQGQSAPFQVELLLVCANEAKYPKDCRQITPPYKGIGRVVDLTKAVYFVARFRFLSEAYMQAKKSGYFHIDAIPYIGGDRFPGIPIGIDEDKWDELHSAFDQQFESENSFTYTTHFKIKYFGYKNAYIDVADSNGVVAPEGESNIARVTFEFAH